MKVINTKLTGITFRFKEQPEIKHLRPEPGDKVSLVPDPKNKYSKTGKAIKVFYRGYHIGFIPEYPDKILGFIFDLITNRKPDIIHSCFDKVYFTDSKDTKNIEFNQIGKGEFHGATLKVVLLEDLNNVESKEEII